MLRGALAAALTPLREDGALDEDAFAPYAGFLAAGGLDGILALGTTGEGMLFSRRERMLVAELYVEARGDLQVAVNCGAQTTTDTVARAERERSDDLTDLRGAVERFPRHAALKLVAARRGVPMQPFVRAPLRRLNDDEERELFGALAPWLEYE